MLSYISRSGPLAPTVKGVSQNVANGVKHIVPAFPISESKLKWPDSSVVLNASSMGKLCSTGKISIRSSIGGSTQVRHAHTDIKVPDFSEYKRDVVKDPTSRNNDSIDGRRSFSYLIAGGGICASTYLAKTAVTTLISSMSATADVLALAKIEIKLNDIPEGKSMTVKWRGKPLFIKHRTPEEIARESEVDVTTLRDPQADSERATEPAWLILVGVCTHLGCVPITDAGDYGGYYCPCHGSHYDGSGRIRKGPAPLNLEVPAHEFPGDGTVIVG